MNINILEVLSNKLASNIIDDCVRAPLYQYKLLKSFKDIRTAESYIELAPKSVVGLPSIKINDVNEFLDFQQSQHIKSFRNHIFAASSSNLSSQQIKNEIKDANNSLLSANKIDLLSLVGVALRVMGSTAGLGAAAATGNPLLTAAAGCMFGSSVIASRDTLNSYWAYQDLNWFRFLKGMSEV